MKCTSQMHILDDQRNTSKQWPQYLAVVAASISAYVIGIHYAWPSPSIPILLSRNSTFNITSDEASYIAIIAPLGDIVGAPAAAIFADVFGRKYGILSISLPAFISLIIIAFSQSMYMFCIGRFISGIGDGILYIVYPMYTGEVTEPKIRGVLGCSLSIAMYVGTLVVNIYGPYLSIRDAALISAVFPVLSVIIFIGMPESPYYLIMKGRMKEAKDALYSLRRYDIENEFQLITKDVQRQMSEQRAFKDLLCVKSHRKALFTMIGIRTIHQMSGISAWGLFTQSIFIKAGGDTSPVIATIIYVCAQIIMTTCGSVLIDKYGRKPVLILSCIFTGLVLYIGGAYFYIKDMTGYDTTAISWIPLVVMVAFVIAFGVGIGAVPSAMLSELFSASIKGKALCIMCIYYSAMISITSKLFHFLTETYGLYSSFLTFGTFTILHSIFAFYFIPETKGKTLEEIQQYFKGNCKHKESTVNK